MSSAAVDVGSLAADEDAIQYRALHIGALIGLVLGILSVFVVITAANSFEGCLIVAPIPIVGMSICLRALAKIRSQPDQYTGATIARIGLALSLIFLIGGVGYGRYVYVREVPEGYTRISFNDLKPDELEVRNGNTIPQTIAELNGRHVFIKGYMRPPEVTRGINEFLLVRDNQQCCFGDIASVKYYDQILVTMKGAPPLDYSQKLFRIGGILKVDQQGANELQGKAVFSLLADYAKEPW